MNVEQIFRENLTYGKIGESRIANWLKRHGFSILPAYNTEINTGKGPQLFTPQKDLIATDMLVYRNKKVLWIEAKHKTAFAWHRISQNWTTGIDLKHYLDYCEIADCSPFPVWLLFLHEGGQAKDSPPHSPSGLFGNSLIYLRKNENHRHNNWGKSGMVYWDINQLRKLAEIETL